MPRDRIGAENVPKLPPFILRNVTAKLEDQGVKPADLVTKIGALTPREAFRMAWQWEGISGYGSTMLDTAEWVFREEGRLDLHRKM